MKYVIRANDLAAFKAVVERGLNVNMVVSDRYQITPIHLAAYYGREEVVLYLVESGADINALKTSGIRTALLTAIWKRHESTALLLLKLGADPNITTGDF